MRAISFVVLLAMFCLPARSVECSPPDETEGNGADFRSLFNGKDLTGWEGQSGIWSVQDGAITGTTSATAPLSENTFLIWRGGPLENFELRLKVQLTGENNSGIQYRSKEQKDAGEFVMSGYQADIFDHPLAAGMLYEEKGRRLLAMAGQKVIITPEGKKMVAGSTAEPVQTTPSEWNEYTIIAHGNHLIHKINGRTTIDVFDHEADNRALSGLLALQVHAGPPMRVQFKDIRLKELPAGGIVPPEKTPLPEAAKEVTIPRITP